MNDWPADPRLDASLRRLVDAELVAARTDAIGLSRRPGRRRDGRAIAGLGALAVIAIVAALVIRGTGSGPQAGAPGSSGSPVNSDGVAISSPSTLDTASPQSSVPTPTPSHTAAPTPRPSGHGTFSATGTMLNPGGMPILLKDGRVLIVGYDATSPQLYDPKTGKFSSTGKALRDGNFDSATLLPDGRVLFVGGIDDASITYASAQIYDPRTGKFSATGSMATSRMAHTATLLKDGRVLIAGGFTYATPTSATPNFVPLAYHPGTRAGTPITQKMTGPDMLTSAEVYDPKTGKFTPTGSMTTGRSSASATRLTDGRVLIMGGGNEGNAAVSTAETYDPKTGKFTATDTMSTLGRYGFESMLLHDGRVLVSGGTDGFGPVYSLIVYDPKTGKFSGAASTAGERGYFSTALLKDGRVLLVGGSSSAFNYLATCEIWDPSTGKFSPTGSMITARSVSATTLLDGRVLVAGGYHEGGPLLSAELYEP